MKVFLSHSTKDKQFVQTLAGELEAAKIEPWLCEVDIELGDNFVAEIEEGLRDADLTVLFWSPEAARSDWTRLEWTAVTAREISESLGRCLAARPSDPGGYRHQRAGFVRPSPPSESITPGSSSAITTIDSSLEAVS